ncbi:MAG: hypothetical protein ACOC4C_03335, partial [Fibrobacterota bacterium]
PVNSRADDFAVFDTLWNHIYRNFDLLPEYHLEADIFTFFFHKNDHFKQWYFLEANTIPSFSLFSFRDRLYFIWEFDFQFGMGQTPGNIVFDPMDINFGITPILELRFPLYRFQAGLEHKCFHEIDRKEFETVYWNKLILAAGSSNLRQYDFWKSLAQDNWEFSDRFSWYVRGGYYLKEFFGLVQSSKLNGQNDRIYDISTDFRYAFYKRRSWNLNGRIKGLLGHGKGNRDLYLFWRYDFCLESSHRKGERGGMLFLQYTLDKLPLYQGVPRFSKDRLLQVGIRLFY